MHWKRLSEHRDGSKSATDDPRAEVLESYGRLAHAQECTVKESRNPGW
jgi:hypothetical protein